jgi:hypothetical protein
MAFHDLGQLAVQAKKTPVLGKVSPPDGEVLGGHRARELQRQLLRRPGAAGGKTGVQLDPVLEEHLAHGAQKLVLLCE